MNRPKDLRLGNLGRGKENNEKNLSMDSKRAKLSD
jgi:hypothetical protein